MNANEIKELFNQYKKEFDHQTVFHHGTVVGVLNKACNGEANRRLVLKELTGKTSTKELNDCDFYALYRFVQPFKPVGGTWGSEKGAELESMCSTLLLAHVDQEGQTKMFSDATPQAE